MSFRLNNKADVEAGLFFALLGGMTAALSLQYEIGTIAAMGPGMFPLILGVLLTILGLGILVKGMFSGEVAKTLLWKPAILVILALLAFAFLVLSVGLVAAVPAQVFIALRASDHFTLKRAIALSIGLLLFCYIVFIYFLGIAVPMIAV
ncbi:tripartite tricarboxylate transporter TctB family protein [Neorhizobium sp. DT-125]|uniref:tripartite tricarboxylate transporter TctB family protein n=1 Tax=Neorhizobium sp. DT-125 TaxID=3396163 RepID=UPI003F19479D